MFNKPFFWWPPPYYRQEVLGSVIVHSTPPQRVNEVAEVHGEDEIIPIPRKVATPSILKLDNDQVDTYWNIDDYVAVHMERWMLLWSLYMVAYSPGWRRFAYWKCPSTYRVTCQFSHPCDDYFFSMLRQNGCAVTGTRNFEWWCTKWKDMATSYSLISVVRLCTTKDRYVGVTHQQPLHRQILRTVQYVISPDLFPIPHWWSVKSQTDTGT